MGMRHVLAAVAAAQMVACSFSIQGPPRTPPVPGPGPGASPAPPACKTSSALPAIDIIGALGWTVLVASVQSLKGLPSDDPDGDDARANGTMIVFGGFAVLHVAAAVVGSRRMSRCRAVRDAWGAPES